MPARTVGRLFLAALCLAFAGNVLAQHRLVTGADKREAFRTSLSPLLLQERGVELDLPALAKAAADASPFLEIAFFPDAVLQVYLKGSERTHSAGTAYVGHAVTDPLSPAVLVDNAGTVSILVSAQGRRFSIQGSPETGYTAREHAAFDRPDHPPTWVNPPTPALAVPASLAPSKINPVYVPPPATSRDDGSTMDVMVVYTPAARAANGGTATMNANVDAQIALTNVVYGNSAVVQRLRLVYKGEVAYTEVNMDVDLARLAVTADGFLDEVPILRNLYAADFVSLWGVYGDYCGLGYLMITESASFAGSAYNTVGSPSCTSAGSYTFAHELGHNMGLRHDNHVDNAGTTVTAEVGGATTPVAYAHGYIDLANRFRTVMSYNDQCVASGFNCTRIPHFSNPAISYNNSGSYAPAVLATTGNALNAHERQALNDTRETTANFRAGLATFTGPGIVTFAPLSYTVAEGAGSVVLKVGRHVGSTGAITVDYATASGTATAGADFTTSTGTLSWANGDAAEKTITVPILQDAILEGNETFTVTLSVPTGGAAIGSAAGTSQAATVRITDDETDTFPIGTLLPGGMVSPNNPNANTASTVWGVDLTDGYLSTASLQSAQARSPTGTFTDFGYSDLEFTGVFLAGNVSFAYKLSSYHSNLAGFEFQVDGVAVLSNNVGGEVPWTQASQAITAGVHTLRWRFKNKLPFPCANANPAPPGGGNCADRLWIDGLSMPLARKFDLSAEGRTDLLWKHTDGRWAVWLMNGVAATATSEILAGGTGWTVVQVADFDGDAKADLLWQHPDGRAAIWLMNGNAIKSTAQILGAGGGWSAVHAVDLSGDGKADIVWQNTNGSTAVWVMNGTAVTAGSTILGAGTGWSVAKTGDFDGDGKADLLWQHTDGRAAIWLMNGNAVKSTAQILNAGGGWSAAHTPDLNGDGRADIVWANANGSVAVWLMNGTAMTGGSSILGAATGWSVAKTGDFDGDGKADLLWQHTDGRAAIWLMNGNAVKSTAQILNAGGGWSAARLGDLNGDGKADIVWANTNGATAAWLMNGTAMSAGGTLMGAGAPWSVSTASP